MKTPPFLLGAALLFWGWQSGFLIPGAAMALILEGSRFLKQRWDFSGNDFRRIWTFCALLFLAGAVYAFTDNGGPERFGHFFQGPDLTSEREAGSASARTAASLIRWLPMLFVLFVAAQVYSTAQKIPLNAISLFLRWQEKQAKKHGRPAPLVREVDVSYPYFALCLFAAGVHHNENNNFFWGLCVLIAWALWLHRPRRFAVAIWTGALALAVLFGYSGARGIGFLQRYVDTLDVQWIAQWFGHNRTDPFKNQTQIGQIGRIKTSTRIVIRLQPESGPPPAYLREATYRTYHFSVWHADAYKNDFAFVAHASTNDDTWPLLPDKTNASRIGIVCYLQGEEPTTHNPLGVLPLPPGSTRLENLPAYVLRTNSIGTVLAEGPGLIQFDALYGPGATIDTPPETNALPQTGPALKMAALGQLGRDNPEEPLPENSRPIDLQVPTNEIQTLETIASQLGLRDKNRQQALQIVGEFFATNFTYRTWQDADLHPTRHQSPLTRFLLETHAGHCEYFATATVLLLREIGIPARYAVGYSVHETSWKGYVVRQRDAHAWCLVWNGDKKIWENFDTTPGSWFAVESEHGPASAWLSDIWWWVQFQFTKLRWGQTHVRLYILIALVPVLAIVFFQIIRQRRRRTRGKAGAAVPMIVWPGLDSEFYQIETRLSQCGVPREPNETLANWLKRAAAEPSFHTLNAPLRALLQLHYRYRFDPNGLTGADREQLRIQARECLDKLSGLQPASQ